MFRIISGRWKSKRISAPKNFEVRPTTDFAKEALFSIIENRYHFDFASVSVLDLFGGIGSISLEFASRECQDVTAVEMNPKHAAFISSTAAELEMALQINVQRADVYDYLKKNRNRESYDIVLADPTFDTTEEKYQELIALVLSNGFLKDDGIFILEHQSRLKLTHSNLLDTRKYGNVSFSFFKANEPQITDHPTEAPATEDADPEKNGL
ncbi:RsmD family RNA methyltransferase [Kaistella palustris]|uniref:RsmD family RNA methyltransferase n=1 Tax=Kaistella palustris TaxID=493376 RepID=UPI0004093765|nr:RsmD family RNA methyltransferase [Kaistella palustris]